MEGKKKYVALILFLLIGLTLFAFANPAEEEKGSKEGNGNQTEEITKDTENDTTGEILEVLEETTTLVLQNVDNSYAKALAAVEAAEKSLLAGDVTIAKDLIDDLLDENQQNELLERIDIVEESMTAVALVEKLESLVAKADSKDDVEDSRNYRTDEQVVETVENLRNETVQADLMERLAVLAEILDDETAPVITGIENNEATKNNVSLTITDATDVTTTVTLNGEEVDYTDTFTKEGVYTVTVVDEAFNEETITFTIDKTNPIVTGVNNNYYYNAPITINTIRDTAPIKSATIDDEDYELGTEYAEEGEHLLVIYDEAGNRLRVKFTIDTTNPAITKVPADGAYVNHSVSPKVEDVNLDKVTLTKNGKEVVGYQDNMYELSHEGTYVLTATDLAGNKTTTTFTIDTVNPIVEGVNNKYYYNKPITITTIRDLAPIKSATIDGKDYELGTAYAEEGEHLLVIYDEAGNRLRVKFTIDTTNPAITKVPADGAYVNHSVSPKVEDANLDKVTLTKNGTEVVGYQDNMYELSHDGTYTLTATDLAGNKTTTTFTIDTVNPIVEGVNNKYYYNKPITITTIRDLAPIKSATIDGKDYELGTEYFEEGEHKLEIYDMAGNRLGVNFTMDKTNPIVEGVNNNYYYNKPITINTIRDVSPIKSATIDGEDYELGTEYFEEGVHYLEIYDMAGNRLGVNFTMDETAPVLTTRVTDGRTYITGKDLTHIQFTIYKGGKEKHSFNSKTSEGGKSFSLSTEWFGNGEYTIVAVDEAGNDTTINTYVTKNEITALKYTDSVTLTKDVALDEMITVAEGTTKVIDLNGHTLTVKNTDEASGYTKRMIQNYGTLTIKNGTLVNDTVTAYGIVDNHSTGEITLDNVKVEDKGSYDGSSIKNRNGKVTVTNSEFTITSVTGYKTTGAEKDKKYGNTAVWNDGTLVIKDTKITSDSDRAYALTQSSGTATIENVNAKGNHGGLAVIGGTSTINNMYYESDVHYGIYVANNAKEGTNVTINGGKFVGQLQGIYIGNEKDLGDVEVKINGGEFSSKALKEALIVVKGKATHKFDVTIKGGTFTNTDVTKYVAAGYVQNENGVVAKDGISVTTATQLKDLFANTKNIAGKTIILENDLDMTGIEWQAANNVSFTLDGNGHTIKNLTYTTEGSVGIFVNHSAAKDLTFKNLIIENATLATTGTTGHIAAGFFVGDADTVDSITIQNCTVKNSTINAFDYAGGFVGYTAGWNVQNDGPVYSDILIENSEFINNTITAGGSVGGAVAHAGGNPDTTVTVKNFKAENNVLNGETGRDKTGIVIGTAGVGKTYINNVTQTNNTIFGEENSDTIYGRFVPNSTGKLEIDGTEIK